MPENEIMPLIDDEFKESKEGTIKSFLDRWYEPGPQSAAIALGECFTLGLESSKVYPWIWRTFPELSAKAAYLFMHFNDLLHSNPEYLHRLKEAILSPGGAAFLAATGFGTLLFIDLTNRVSRSVLTLFKHDKDNDE